MSKKLFMKPLKALASPGIYLFGKYNQYKRERRQSNVPSTPAENELSQLNTKIDKLLHKLNGKYVEVATTPEEECVICINAKAVMQTYPCSHKVVCRQCFVKTIQIALSQRTLPLRCVVCRAKILRLKHTQDHANRISSVPPFHCRMSSRNVSKRPSDTVSHNNYPFEPICWPTVPKYSRSLPGINAGSFNCKPSVNRFHSAVVYRQSINSMRKCCRSCSLNSCSSDRNRKCEYFIKTDCQRVRESNNVQTSEKPKSVCELETKNESRSLNGSTSRETLIRQFQRDFKEGQLSTRFNSTSRTKAMVDKVSSMPPFQDITNSKETTTAKSGQKYECRCSYNEKRKPNENVTATDGQKYRDKQSAKGKEKSSTSKKAIRLLKLEKKDKNKTSNDTMCKSVSKNGRKETKIKIM